MLQFFLYRYEYSRHNKPVSLFFIHFPKFQDDISFFVEMLLQNSNCR